MDDQIEIIRTYNKYKEILQKQKMNRLKYNLVNTGKEIIENFNTSLLPNFNNYKDPYINIQLKFKKIISDLDIVNLNLTESYEIFEMVQEQRRMAANNNAINPELLIFNSFYYNKINKLNEYIAFDLKHCIDEIISTVWVIKNNIRNGKIEVSSIGNYLKKYRERHAEYNEFDNFLDLFEKLDDISNAYKHSYANTDFAALGRDEDCFVALYSKYNDFSKKPQFYCVSVDYIINEFNKFYRKTFNLINKLTESIV